MPHSGCSGESQYQKSEKEIGTGKERMSGRVRKTVQEKEKMRARGYNRKKEVKQEKEGARE